MPLDERNKVAEFAPGIRIPVHPFFGNLGVAPPMGRLNSVRHTTSHFHLQGASCTDEQLAPLAKIKNVVSLNLGKTSITDAEAA